MEKIIKIWQECASFQTTCQRLAYQVRTILKKVWVSDLEITEIHQKLNNEPESYTVPDTSSINKQKHPNRNETPTSENGNVTQPNNAQT